MITFFAPLEEAGCDGEVLCCGELVQDARPVFEPFLGDFINGFGRARLMMGLFGRVIIIFVGSKLAERIGTFQSPAQGIIESHRSGRRLFLIG